MYSRFGLAFKYLLYYVTASSGKGHGIHSPFVFRFIKDVLNDRVRYADYDRVERLREKMHRDKREIVVEDLGAGISGTVNQQRAVSSIARKAIKPRKYGQLLHRMVHYYQPGTILELGTSLGITTSYIAMANPKARVITIEGAGTIAEIARKNFESLSLKNIEMVEGNFDQKLSPVIQDLPSVDFAFIDGNHRQEATERYFRQVLPRLEKNSVLVFDDIHWSRGMEKAWENIKSHPSVNCSIDLFFMGIVFFNEVFRDKQDFTLRF